MVGRIWGHKVSTFVLWRNCNALSVPKKYCMSKNLSCRRAAACSGIIPKFLRFVYKQELSRQSFHPSTADVLRRRIQSEMPALNTCGYSGRLLDATMQNVLQKHGCKLPKKEFRICSYRKSVCYVVLMLQRYGKIMKCANKYPQIVAPTCYFYTHFARHIEKKIIFAPETIIQR